MTHYRLYYAPGACSVAVHVALERVRAAGAADYATTRLLLPAGDQRSAEFLAVNPRGHVPALVFRVDEQPQTLTETLAILQWLHAAHPQASLLPAAALSVARAWEWLSWLATDVHAHAFMQVFYPARYAAEPAAQAAVAASGRALLTRCWVDLEARIGATVAEDGFLLGSFSVVDAYLIAFYRWARRYGFTPERHYPNWTALTQRTLAQASVAQVFAEEKISLDDPLPARLPAPSAQENAA
jgi:glutathione S-transferase